MNREEKAAVIDQIADEIGASEAIFALDYRGITVAQTADLREKLRASQTKLRVTKNSLAERAADQAGVDQIKPLLVGPTALALVKGDPAAAAKVLSDTSRALRGPLVFKGGVLSGDFLTAEQVDAIAKLPSREVLYAQLVGTIAAPLSGLARTLNALIGGLAIQLGQIRDQGLVSGTAPAAAAEAPVAEAAEVEAPAAVAAEVEAPVAEAAEVETPAAEVEAPEPEVDVAPEAPEADDAPEAPEAEAAPEPEPEAEAAPEPEAEAAPAAEAEPEPETEPAPAAQDTDADA